MNKRIKENGAQSPNDPKLSDSPGWRDRCAVGERWRQEAAGVTAGRVRCSAWLGVSGRIGVAVKIEKAWKEGEEQNGYPGTGERPDQVTDAHRPMAHAGVVPVKPSVAGVACDDELERVEPLVMDGDAVAERKSNGPSGEQQNEKEDAEEKRAATTKPADTAIERPEDAHDDENRDERAGVVIRTNESVGTAHVERRFE